MRRHAAVLAFAFLICLPVHAAITGLAMTPDGEPIAGARVSIYALETPEAQSVRLLSKTPERPALASVETDSKGKFNLATPKEAVVQVIFRATGYGQLALRAERDDELGAITLRKAELKTGTITFDGKPVPGATVVWTGNGEFIATTDARGRYSVPDPAKWASEVALIHPDYAGVTEPAAPIMRSTVAVDRAFPKAVAVSGKVVAEDGKTPVAGAEVIMPGVAPVISAADGSFTVPHVSDKWKLVKARLGDRIGMRVRAGSTPPIIRLSKGGVLSGTIRDLKSGLPVAGADLRLRQPSRFDQSGALTTLSDAKGNFTLAGVPAGTYDLATIRPGYAIESVSVTLGEGEKVSKRLMATQLGRVTGIVVDEQKRAVPAASIGFRNLAPREPMMFIGPSFATPSGPAASAPDGTFVLRVSPDAELELTATRKGYPSSRPAALKVAPGERRSGITLTIPSGMPVTGRVTDRQGKPLSGVVVEATETSSAPSGQIIRRMAFSNIRERDDAIKTDDKGAFSVRLKEGSFDFGFRREGFSSKVSRSVQVNAATKPLEISLDPGVDITGRVTRAGQPLSGAYVNVLSEGATASTQTADDGSFKLSDLLPGPTMLMITKTEDFVQQSKTVTAPATDVVIDVPAGGRVSGRVIDKSTRQPITSFEAGMSVVRGGGGITMMSANMLRPFTSDDGSFVMENVAPGSMQLMVRAPGYPMTRVPNLNVESGKSLDDVTVEMDKGVRLVGRVTGPDGSPLAGVAVRVDPRAERMRIIGTEASASTDESGNYTIDALEAGDKTFMFVRSGYLTAEKTVTLSGSEVRADVQLSTGMRVAGSVVTDSGIPVADANVYASSPSQSGFGSRSARTDANGNFTMEALAPGRYTFNASKTGYASGDLRDFDISAGAPVVIKLRSGGVIYGQVTGLTADELQQTTVMAYATAGGGASAAVDATGNYRIEGAPTGTVRVSARLGTAFPGGRSSAVQSVQVDAGSEVKVDVVFKNDTTIRGRVTRNGQPVDGAMVNFSPKQPPVQTTARTSANANGEYQVSGLDDGMYDVVVVDMQRSAPFLSTYQVRGSGTFDVDMKSATLRGRVTSSDGDAVPDVAIDLRESSEGGMRFALRSAMTDAGGAFTIENVSPGTYNVSATKPGYGTKAVPVTVTDNGGDVSITLSKNAGVVLTVVDARDHRPIAAMVHVTDMQGRVVYDTPGFGGGTAEPQKLPLEPGTYRATVVSMGYGFGYAPQTITLTSPSSPTVGLTPGGSIAVQSKDSVVRRGRLLGADGKEYSRGFGSGWNFSIDPNPGVTILNNITPGTYTLQILGDNGEVKASSPVTVMEGQRAQVSL